MAEDYLHHKGEKQNKQPIVILPCLHFNLLELPPSLYMEKPG
jgi:hypothetical protein